MAYSDAAIILGKGLKGVAEVGIPAALEDLRGKIAMQRDAKLQEYRAKNLKDEQTWRSGERTAAQTFAAGEAKKDRKMTREEKQKDRQARKREAKKNRQSAETIAETRNRGSGSGGYMSPEEKLAEGLMRAGLAPDKATAMQMARTDKRFGEILRLVGEDLDAQTTNLIEPGHEDYQSPEALVEKYLGVMLQAGSAEGVIAGARRGAGEGGGSGRTIEDAARPQSQADYDALPSGAYFIDPDDGSLLRKP